MSNDILGYKMETPERLISSDNAFLLIGGNVQLLQNVEGRYRHKVIPRYQASSSQMFWVSGQPGGEISTGRLVSKGGFFAGMPLDSAACRLVSATIGVNPGCSTFSVANGAGSLTFSGGIVAEVGASINVGNLEVSESMTMIVSGLRK